MLRLRIILPAAGLLLAAAACGAGGGGIGGLELDAELQQVKCTGENGSSECTASYELEVTNTTDSEAEPPDFSFLAGDGEVALEECVDPIPAGESCEAQVLVRGAPDSSATLLATSGFLFGSITLDIPVDN